MNKEKKNLQKLEKQLAKLQKACKKAIQQRKEVKARYKVELEKLKKTLRPLKKAWKKAKKEQKAICCNCQEKKHEIVTLRATKKDKKKPKKKKIKPTPLQKIVAIKRPLLKASSLPSAPAPPKTDNLKLIEGIGPKIEEVLQNAGIRTFVKLSRADTMDLETILRAAGPRFRMHNPATWARQARLAAEGKMEELKELQDELKGGREV